MAREAQGQTSIFDLLEPEGDHAPGACALERTRWRDKSCCVLRGSEIWTNCREVGRCTMRGAAALPSEHEPEEEG